MSQDDSDYFATIEPPTTADVPPTLEAAEIATRTMRGELGGTEAIAAMAQHFLATVPEVDMVIATLTLSDPHPTTGWYRLGDRTWGREWVRPGSSYAQGAKLSDARALISMPWIAQRARRTGLVVVPDVRELPAAAAEDRRKCEEFGLTAGITAALVGDEALLGTFALSCARPYQWPASVVADALLLRAAITGRIAIERARTALALAVSRGDRAEQSQEHLFSILELDLHGPLADLLARQQDDVSERVADTVRQALAVIHDVLEMRRELARADLEWVDLDQAVADVARWVRTSVNNGGLELEIAPPTGIQVRTTATALRRILVNLLGNAIARTPPGGLVRLEITSSESAGRVRIGVHDTGPTLSLEQQADLFRPTEKATPTMPGTGLGLPVSRSLAERDGGTIGVTSAEGGVTTWVELRGRGRPTSL